MSKKPTTGPKMINIRPEPFPFHAYEVERECDDGTDLNPIEPVTCQRVNTVQNHPESVMFINIPDPATPVAPDNIQIVAIFNDVVSVKWIDPEAK